MNVFSGSKAWAEAAEHMGMTIPAVQKTVSEGKANQTRGSPEGKASREIFTLSKDYTKEVHKDDRASFNRILADKTRNIEDGQKVHVEINGAKRVYFFVADGYMNGEIVKSVSNKRPNLYAKAKGEFYDSIKQRGESADIWAEFDYLIEKGSIEDFRRLEYQGRADRNDSLFEEPSTSNSGRSERRNVEYNYSPEEAKELTKQLKQKFSFEQGKASREIDTAYLDAVKSGDMETAQKMVDEAAKLQIVKVNCLYFDFALKF